MIYTDSKDNNSAFIESVYERLEIEVVEMSESNLIVTSGGAPAPTGGIQFPDDEE